MSSRNRNGSVLSRSRLAKSQDLMEALNQSEKVRKPEGAQVSGSEIFRGYASIFLKNIPPIGTIYEPMQRITKKLQQIIKENYYTSAFERAIVFVSKQKIPELNKIQTLYQFYYYIDELVTWIPEIRVWDWYGETLHERTDYLRITQFYYYFNQPELEALQSPVAPLNGENLSPLSLWLREFAIQWGEFLDTEESKKYLESYKYAPEYAWQEYQKEPEDYKSFNEWFARQFKNIDTQRPVAQPKEDRVVVFPSESTFVGQWSISTGVGDPLPAPPSIVIKHIEWSIEELLHDSKFKDDFAGGIFCHSFLNVYDYHRQHAPVSGKILEAKFIPGQVYLEVILEHLNKGGEENTNPDLANAVVPQRYLDAEDPTGYQFVQCRGLLILDSPIGKVAVLPMGMAQVSSVVFVTPEADGHKPIMLTSQEKKALDYDGQVRELNKKLENTLVGKTLKKGEMFSYFQFGGSDIVVIFERMANVNVTATIGTHYPVRSQYAISNIDKLRSVK